MRRLLAGAAAATLSLAAPAQAAVINLVAGQLASQASPADYTSAGSCSVGQVAVVLTYASSGALTSVTDSVGNTYTADTVVSSSSTRFQAFKTVVSSAITSATVVHLNFAGSLPTAAIVDCVDDGTAIPTSADGTATSGGVGQTGISQSVTPSSAPAYMFAGVAASGNITTYSAAAGWTTDQVVGTTAGVRSYYRVINPAAPTAFATTMSNSAWAMGWTEVTQGGAPATGVSDTMELLGVQ